jgi:hypothetical protein
VEERSRAFRLSFVFGGQNQDEVLGGLKGCLGEKFDVNFGETSMTCVQCTVECGKQLSLLV